MLKAKTTKTSYSSAKEEAIREILKPDELKRLNVNIPKPLYLELKKKLAELDIPISDWIRKQIESFIRQ